MFLTLAWIPNYFDCKARKIKLAARTLTLNLTSIDPKGEKVRIIKKIKRTIKDLDLDYNLFLGDIQEFYLLVRTRKIMRAVRTSTLTLTLTLNLTLNLETCMSLIQKVR